MNLKWYEFPKSAASLQMGQRFKERDAQVIIQLEEAQVAMPRTSKSTHLLTKAIKISNLMEIKTVKTTFQSIHLICL